MKRLAVALIVLTGALAIRDAPAQRRDRRLPQLDCNSCESCTAAFERAATVRLTADLETDHDGVCIDINRVRHRTLNCDGHTLRATGGAFDATGIRIVDANRITIHSCTILGMNTGIRLEGATGAMVATNDLHDGLPFDSVGIAVGSSVRRASRNNQIMGNRVADFVGGIELGAGASGNVVRENSVSGRTQPGKFGITIRGHRNHVSDNDVRLASKGITIFGDQNRIRGNDVYQNASHGIELWTSAEYNSLLGNTLLGNGGYDLFNRDASNGNWGDNNRCETVVNWRDKSADADGCADSL